MTAFMEAFIAVLRHNVSYPIPTDDDLATPCASSPVSFSGLCFPSVFGLFFFFFLPFVLNTTWC